MSRLRALLAAAGVTVSVFTYLALPILREWYGPAVDLVVYAGIALVAGGLTYGLVRGLAADGATAGREAYEEDVAVEAGDADTDEEIEELLKEME